LRQKSQTKVGKFNVSYRFVFKNSRSEFNNGNPYNYSANNLKLIKKAKPPTQKQLSAYMKKDRRYSNFVDNVYSYGNYGKPSVKSYKNGRVSYVIDPTKQNSRGKIIFPTAQSIKNNLNNGGRMGISDCIFNKGPGGPCVYPVKISEGQGPLGRIIFNNVKVSKIK